MVSDEGAVIDAIRKVNRDAGKEIINHLLYQFSDMAVELYNLRWPIVSPEFRKVCPRVKDHNGFEVYRSISAGKDIVYPMSAWGMKAEVWGLSIKTATTIKSTKMLLDILESLAKSYVDRFADDLADGLTASP